MIAKLDLRTVERLWMRLTPRRLKIASGTRLDPSPIVQLYPFDDLLFILILQAMDVSQSWSQYGIGYSSGSGDKNIVSVVDFGWAIVRAVVLSQEKANQAMSSPDLMARLGRVTYSLLTS